MSEELDMKKYIGKEVLYKQSQKARISDVKSYGIYIKLADGSCRMFETGTGEYDNAVADGFIKFTDEALEKAFIEEYERYRHSFIGEAEAFDYNSRRYN